MLGVDGQDLPQTVFLLGIVHGYRAEPQPRVFTARIGDQRQVEQLACFLVLAAPRQGDALSDKVFGVHRQKT